MRRVLLTPNEFTYSAAAGQRELSAAPKPSATVHHTRGFDCMRLANDLAAGDSSSFLLRNLANKSFSSVCESVCVCVGERDTSAGSWPLGRHAFRQGGVGLRRVVPGLVMS